MSLFYRIPDTLSPCLHCGMAYLSVVSIQANADMTGACIGFADARTKKGKGGYILGHRQSYKTLPFCSWTGGCKVCRASTCFS